MHDAKVIAACIASREAYSRVRNFVDAQEFSPQGGAWWPLIVDWYAADQRATGVDVELLRERGKRAFAGKHQETLLGWFDALPPAVSPENAVLSLLEAKRFVKEQELLGSLSGADTKRKAELLDEYRTILDATTLRVRARRVTVDDLLLHDPLADRMRLAPGGLHERTGGIGPGDVAYIFARPEMGKTLMCVTMAARFAKDGHAVLYVGNEEDVEKTMWRVISNLCDRPQPACLENRELAVKAAVARGLSRIEFRHMEPGNLSQIEDEAGELRPRVVLVDQIRNLTGKGQTMTTRMEENAIGFRNLAARYSFAGVGVTQAGDSAGGKQFLDMGDVDSSNTGLPGACDLMVGVGADQLMIDTNRRGISLPKNKLGHTHEGFLVTVDKTRNQVK